MRKTRPCPDWEDWEDCTASLGGGNSDREHGNFGVDIEAKISWVIPGPITCCISHHAPNISQVGVSMTAGLYEGATFYFILTIPPSYPFHGESSSHGLVHPWFDVLQMCHAK